MIVVEIRLRSARSKSRDRALGVLVIANDGKGSPTRGNYTVAASKGRSGRVYTGIVKDFPRASRSVFELLRRALNVVKVP